MSDVNLLCALIIILATITVGGAHIADLTRYRRTGLAITAVGLVAFLGTYVALAYASNG